MKHLMITAATALALSTAVPAVAQDTVFSDMTFDAATNLYASELIGMRVYATEADIDPSMSAGIGSETEWDDIGEINEILLTRDGQVQSVIVGVGGFLGIGEKDVALDMSQIKFVPEEGDDGEFFLVVSANAAGVEEAPSYDRGRDAMAMDSDADAAMEADERDMMLAPEISRDGYQNAVVDDLTTEDLTGARVYGLNDEEVGEVGELLLTDDGKLDRAVIDVGGFLGMGEKQVAVTFDELTIIREDGGDDVRVYIDSTEDALKAQPEYEG